MPTYDYLCVPCGHIFERFESIGDDGRKACPKCGKKKSKRRMGTGAGLIFKGAGFYQTDYKNAPPGGPKKPEKTEKTEKSDKSESGKPSEAKTKEKEPKK